MVVFSFSLNSLNLLTFRFLFVIFIPYDMVIIVYFRPENIYFYGLAQCREYIC